MLQFFRKIRRDLLSENRFSKYLIYAIGEILLVVVGILLALQINNWNEDKKNESLQLNYVKGLISDLEYDIRAYAIGIGEIEAQRTSTDALLLCYRDGKTLPDSILIEHITNIGLISRFSHRNTVMEDMKSAGRLNLITNDSLRLQVIAYYKLASSVIDNNDRNNDWILNHIIASRLYTENFDFNSTVASTNRIPPMMKSIEVTPFAGLPLIDQPNHPDREIIINLLTAKNWLEGLNKTFGLSGRDAAISLKNHLEDYLGKINE